VQFIAERMGAVYGNQYQKNVRSALYQKFSRLSPEQIEQIGTARILPAIINDSTWMKTFHRRIIIFMVYFPIAILGSFLMLFMLSWVYALFAIASLPFVALFFYLTLRKMKKLVPAAVNAYDEYFLNIKEGVKGAKDIRILGKADERNQDFEEHVTANRTMEFQTVKGHAMSTGFNAILFTMITIAIIIYAAAFELEPHQTNSIVVLNTAIQYINKVWTGSHQIFVWFYDYLPRTLYTYKRTNQFYSLPEKEDSTGLTQIPVYQKNHISFVGVTYKTPSGKTELHNISMEVPNGHIAAIAGGVGSGKSNMYDLLIKQRKPTEGQIIFNEIDLEQINVRYWRHDFLSVAANNPRFVPATIRENFKLLNPNVTDEEILSAFKSIGAMDFVRKFDNFLDYEIGENAMLTEGSRNLLNIVRTILKPAVIYVFNQCFEHVQEKYIMKLMTYLRQSKKTSIFISYNDSVCRHSDIIYVFKNGRLTGHGRHGELKKTNRDYRELNSSLSGLLLYQEQHHIDEGVIEDKPHETVLEQGVKPEVHLV